MATYFYAVAIWGSQDSVFSTVSATCFFNFNNKLMKKVTLLLCSLMLAFAASATIIPVDSVQHYAARYGAAANGDTLLLYSGTYQNQNFPVAKSIVVMAPDTCEVYMTGEIRSDGGDFANAGITFINVTIGDGASYLFNFSGSGTIKEIALKNCVLQNVSRCTFYIGAGVTVEQVTLDGCTLTNLNTGNWNFSWSQAIFNAMTFNECTIYNNNGMESFLNNRTASEGSLKFTFTKNTMFTGCRDANRYILQASKNYTGEESEIYFTDNIIVAPEGTSAGKLFDISAGYWTGEIKNNLIHGWVLPELGADYGELTVENNYALTDLAISSTSAIFADAAQGDFTLYKGVSPLDGKASDGGMLGASKWAVSADNLKTLITGLAAGVDSIAGTISGPSGKIAAGKNVTLKAVKGFGYKFVKWVDAAGATLSEDATYTFTMDADATVLAVFVPINVYKLNVTCTGGGSYSVSQAGKGGAYVEYEEGTELMITTVVNKVTEFVMATDADGNTYFTTEFAIVMNKDITLSLEFAQKDYICGWDNFLDGANNSRPADYLSYGYQLAADSSNLPLLEMYYTYIPGAPHGGWWNRDGEGLIWIRCNVTGDQNIYDNDSAQFFKDQGYYLQTAFSTKNYKTDVTMLISLKGSYRFYHEQYIQYSYNNMSWEDVDTLTVGGGWQDYTITIPNSADQDLLYVRVYPNVNGPYNTNNFFDTYGLYFDNIFFMAEYATALEAPKAEQETVIYDIMGRRLMNAERPGLYIINGKKALVK